MFPSARPWSRCSTPRRSSSLGAMNDDWRLEAELFEDANARALSHSLTAEKVSEDLETSFGDQVICAPRSQVAFQTLDGGM